MLKRIMIVCGAVALLNSAAKAQTAEKNLLSSQYGAIALNERAVNHYSEINVNAVRHFSSQFKSVSDEKWTKKEDGYRVSFQKDDIRYMVDYDKKGNWKSTIRIYGEHRLPQEIRREIRSDYLDFEIVTVTELKINNVLSYFVKLEDQHSLKTVRVINGEMDVVEDYVK